MIGKRFNKPLQPDFIVSILDGHEVKTKNTEPNTVSAYRAAAEWCNANQCHIKDFGNYYEIEPVASPPEPTLEDQKRAKIAEINAAYDAATSALVSTYPATELLTFDKQEAEARAYNADPAAETPLVNALAAGRVMDKDELVRRIIAKADAFAVAVGYYTGQRQHYEDQLAAAVTADDISAIVPVYALPDESQSEDTTTETPAEEPTAEPETVPETQESEYPANTEATA